MNSNASRRRTPGAATWPARATGRKHLVLAVAGSLIAATGITAASTTTARPAAAATADATVTVKIEAVRALNETDATSAPDFYPQVYIGGQAFGGSSFEIEDKYEVHPDNWSFTATVPFTSAVATTPVEVRIYDADGGLNGPRDGLDIAGGDADRSLNETVHLLDCAEKVPGVGLTGDLAGKCGPGLVTNGTVSPKASVRFGVTVVIPDSDGDGLYDTWEANGYDADGNGTVDVDLPAMGAKVDHKDLFLELDATDNFRMTRAGIEAVKRAFAAAPIDAGTRAREIPGGVDAKPNPDGQRGINLHIDTGTILDFRASEGTQLGTCNNGIDDGGDGLVDRSDPSCIGFGSYLDASSEDAPGDNNCQKADNDKDGDGLTAANDPDCLLSENLGGGSIVTVEKGPACNLDASFYATKAKAFNPLRARIFRWGLLLPLDGSCKESGGWGEIGGNDFMVFNTDGGSLMHELGHNLRLDHGGFEASNCKPNYVSVMNYDHQSGVSRTGGGTILDYGPPRLNLDGSTRGSVPGQIDEAALDENALLDAGDSLNEFVYTDGKGAKNSIPLNERPNYDADETDPPYESGFASNVDTANTGGKPADCKNDKSDSKLDSQNDWLRISLPFRQFGDSADGPINPETVPHLTTEQLQALDADLHRTDLHLTKTAPVTAVAGTTATYGLKVGNEGPHAATPVVTDSLPAGMTVTSLPAACSQPAPNQVSCVLPEVEPGEEVGVSLTLAITPDLVHLAGAPVNVTNSASVAAVRGADPDPTNNSTSATTRVVAQADLAVTSALVDPPPAELLIGETATVSVTSTTTNGGPSTPMDVRLSTSVLAEAGSSASPAGQSTLLPAIAKGSPRAATATVTLSCSQPGQHTFDVTTSVAPDRPHDTDSYSTNNTSTQQIQLDCVVPIAINVRPRGYPNSINLNTDATVAALTTRAGEYGLPLDFDATSIDVQQTRWGLRAGLFNATTPTGAREIHDEGHPERSYELDERTRDADTDLVLHFKPSDSGLTLGSTEGCLKGKYRAASGSVYTFFGCDSVRVVN